MSLIDVLNDDMVVAAMKEVPGSDHDDIVRALEAALSLAPPVTEPAPLREIDEAMVERARKILYEEGKRLPVGKGALTNSEILRFQTELTCAALTAALSTPLSGGGNG